MKNPMKHAMKKLCQDCKKDTEPMKSGRPIFKRWDSYMVRDEIWLEAGMPPSFDLSIVDGRSGYLCTPCLCARLGRALTDDDYLARPVKATRGRLTMMFTPEYVERIQESRL